MQGCNAAAIRQWDGGHRCARPTRVGSDRRRRTGCSSLQRTRSASACGGVLVAEPLTVHAASRCHNLNRVRRCSSAHRYAMNRILGSSMGHTSRYNSSPPPAAAGNGFSRVFSYSSSRIRFASPDRCRAARRRPPVDTLARSAVMARQIEPPSRLPYTS